MIALTIIHFTMYDKNPLKKHLQLLTVSYNKGRYVISFPCLPIYVYSLYSISALPYYNNCPENDTPVYAIIDIE